MTILSQAKWTDGTLTDWCNEKLGFSDNLIWAKGDQLTLLAEILGLTPTEVNTQLKLKGTFDGDQIIWERLSEAFPEWIGAVFEPYNNDSVLKALTTGLNVIVSTDKQAVRYVGNGKCHDPKTGKEKNTGEFPDVKSFIVITHVPTTTVELEKPVVTIDDKVVESNPLVPKDVVLAINTDNFVMKKKPGRPKGFHPTSKKVETDPKKAIKKYLKQIHVASLAIKQLMDL